MFLLKSDIVHQQKIDLSLEHIRLYIKICFILIKLCIIRNMPGKTYDKMVLEAKDLFITVIYINAYAIYDMHINF